MPKRTVISKTTLAVTANPNPVISAGNMTKELIRLQNNSAVVITVITDPTQQTGGWVIQPGASENFFMSGPLYAYSASVTPSVDVLEQFLM